MPPGDKELIDLFKKITAVHFLTDYSSIDFMYPPTFIWDALISERIFKLEKKFSPGNYALYVHFPFCRSKCKFCRQFSLAVKNKKLYKEYIDLLIKELRLYAGAIDIHSLFNVYLGGGTPTLFPLDTFFEALYKYTRIHPIAQINVESTPESLNYKKLRMLKKWGVNRLLMGLQSLDPKVLKLINRSQNKFHFYKMFHYAQEIGIPVINLELVAGMPEQTMQSFLNDLKTIIGLRPSSIHIYGYMNLPKTIFYGKNYRLGQAEFELRDKMMLEGKKMLKDANYVYRRDDYCLHDDAALRNQAIAEPDYFTRFKVTGCISLGPSAIGRLRLKNGFWLRYINIMDYQKYKENIERKKFPVERGFVLNRDEQKRATMIKFYRDGILRFKKKQGRKKSFSSEMAYLKRQGKIKFHLRDGNVKILFSSENNLTHHRIFYSPKVLQKCRKVIDKKYADSDLAANLNFQN